MLGFSQQTLPFFFHFTLSFLASVQSADIAFFLSFYTFFPCLGSVRKHCLFSFILHFLSLLDFSQQTLPFFFHFTLSFLPWLQSANIVIFFYYTFFPCLDSVSKHCIFSFITLSFLSWDQSANIAFCLSFNTFFPCLGSVSRHCLFSFILHFLSLLGDSLQTIAFFLFITLSFLAWVQSANIAFFLFYTLSFLAWIQSAHIAFFLLLHFLPMLGDSLQTIAFFLSFYTFFPCLGSVSKHCLFSFITLSFLAWVQSANIAFFLLLHFLSLLGFSQQTLPFFFLLHFLSLLGFSLQTLPFFFLLHFLSLLGFSQQTLPFFFFIHFLSLLGFSQQTLHFFFYYTFFPCLGTVCKPLPFFFYYTFFPCLDSVSKHCIFSFITLSFLAWIQSANIAFFLLLLFLSILRFSQQKLHFFFY